MHSGQFPLISIITLHFNQVELTRAFLESSRKLSYPNYEILVCDMHSETDPSEAITFSDFPNTRLLKSNENLGFAGGNNFGIRQAAGEFYLLINNDTEFTPGLLQHLLAPFFIDPSIGITCPKILSYYFPDTIEYAGFGKMNFLTGRTRATGFGEKDRGQFDISGETNAPHGCAMLVNRATIEKAGLLPEVFFLYYEEWDWSVNIHKAGLKIWYTAEAVVFHKQSGTIGNSNPDKVYYQTRNRILFMRRNASLFQLILFTGFFSVFTIPKNIITYFATKRIGHLKCFLKGIQWNLSTSGRSIR